MENNQQKLDIDIQMHATDNEKYEFEPLQGRPMLQWRGKRPFKSTHFYPAQLKESFGEPVNDWMNKLYWGDNLQVLSHLLKDYRGKIQLIYIDPPFDSKADYKKKVELRGKEIKNDYNSFEEKQYTDIWTNDEYLQFMYERLIVMRELLSENGCIYLHCDYRKVHHLRCLMDEIFGESSFLNSLVWTFDTRSSRKSSWKRCHNDLLLYKKDHPPVFNWSEETVLEALSEETIAKYRLEDENGKYRLNGRNVKGSPIQSAKDVDTSWEITHPELVVRDYLRPGKVPSDYFHIPIENQASHNRTEYPTQKPEELLYKLILASSNEGDIVLDCFMGSGTVPAVALKLGRRFIGVDINMGSVQTTTQRLLKAKNDVEFGQLRFDETATYFTSFQVYSVNNYDIFRNPVQAKELLMEALEIQKLHNNSIFDGEKDGRKVKIMPVNRIAAQEDVINLARNLDYKSYEKKKKDHPHSPVDQITLVCMGHEPDISAKFVKETGYNIDVKVLDILRDREDLCFERDSEADIKIEEGKLVIRSFYPMNLLQKISMFKEDIEDWRELVDAVYIDWDYDGETMKPAVIDIPEDKKLVSGQYDVPEGARNIKIKIVDLLSEAYEGEIYNG